MQEVAPLAGSEGDACLRDRKPAEFGS